MLALIVALAIQVPDKPCGPNDNMCAEVETVDQTIIYLINEEIRRQELLRNRNKKLPVCPVSVWDTELVCA